MYKYILKSNQTGTIIQTFYNKARAIKVLKLLEQEEKEQGFFLNFFELITEKNICRHCGKVHKKKTAICD